MYECRYCSIKAELPCRRLHTPAGAGPQKVVPVTRCTLVTAGKARGEGWQITMRASCQVARILIRLEGMWEEKRQTLRGLRTMRGVGTLDSCLPASRRSATHNAEDTDKAGEPSEGGERHTVWRERGNTSHPSSWRSASDDSRSGQKLELVFQGKKNEKRLIYGTGFSARHDSPTSICFFFCCVSFTAPALPGQSPPSVTFFLFFLFSGLQLNQPRVSREK